MQINDDCEYNFECQNFKRAAAAYVRHIVPAAATTANYMQFILFGYMYLFSGRLCRLLLLPMGSEICRIANVSAVRFYVLV